ncbi:hypothetical protein [Methylobacterium komagatae]
MSNSPAVGPQNAKRSKNTSAASLSPTELQHHVQELGLLGRVFGSKDHAPVYIAGAIAIIGMIGICIASAVPGSVDFSRADLIKALSGIILAALTFLGGVYSGSRR